MKRLHITAEGQTEESFVNRTLKPHLAKFGVYSDVRCVLTGRQKNKVFRGGMTSYCKAKNDILKWLREEQNNRDVAFTTMFDYYALPNDFPGHSKAQEFQDPYKKVAFIEAEMEHDIADRRFIPYIQLHEFETLLFTNPQKFEIEFFDDIDGINFLKDIASEFKNPELINQGIETAPSKRIISIYPRYKDNKSTIGSMIAHEIGIDALKNTCKHFREWITKLEQLG